MGESDYYTGRQLLQQALHPLLQTIRIGGSELCQARSYSENDMRYYLLIVLCVCGISAPAHSGDELLSNREEGLRFWYAGEQLQQQWPQLHHADGIPFPDQDAIQTLLQPYLGGELEAEVLPAEFRGNYAALAAEVQQAWRLFHAGQYKDAYQYADRLGLAGLLPKLRSQAIHHHYFLPSRKQRQTTFAALIREIESLQKRYQLESPAIYLLKAFAIGRYGQEINPVSAFAKGLGGKLKYNIYRAAELAPENIEAMMFKAVFDAEAINNAGSVASKLLYGASKQRARKYFQRALEHAPGYSALLLEYGKACLYICPRKQREQGYVVLQGLAELPELDLIDVENKKIAAQILRARATRKRRKPPPSPIPVG